MRFVGCDLCGSSEVAVVFTWQDPRVPDGERTFRVVECQGCGLIYLNPRPEGSEMVAYYPQDYYDDLGPFRGRTGRRAPSLRKLRKSVRRALLERCYNYPTLTGASYSKANGLLGLMKTACLQMERWRLQAGGREAAIIPFVGKGQLLDVGCAIGKALESFRELGWNVAGVEISPYAASIARVRLGCDILVGEFEDVTLEDDRFDVVRFSHSLEHLPSPRKALAKARRLLRPGGLLWIEVPNAASLDRWLFGKHWFCWDLPRHLYHFTPDTLTRLLACTGFRPLRITCDGRVNFFTMSIANALTQGLGIRPRRMKVISTLARPLVYVLGAMNRGAILTVHAEKDRTVSLVSSGRRVGMQSGGSAG